MKYQILSNMSEEENHFIREKLDEFSDPFNGLRNPSDVGLVLRDDDGTVMGGFIGSIIWDWLHINVLWVAENLRGAGYGNELLLAGECTAKNKGCNFAKLHTFEFQSRDSMNRMFTR